MDKRGISVVIAIVVTIAMTTVGVVIILRAVVPLITDSIAFTDLDNKVGVLTTEGYTGYDPATQIATVQVKRGLDDVYVKRIRIFFMIDGDSYSSTVEAPGLGETKTYTFSFSGYGIPTAVQVAPIFVFENGQEKEGPVTPWADLSDATIIDAGVYSCSLENDCYPDVPIGCNDNIRNVNETDVDCGGPDCEDCSLGDACLIDGDCLSNECVGNVCVTCQFTNAYWNETNVIEGAIVEMIVTGTNCDASDVIDFSIWEDDGVVDDLVETVNGNFSVATWISVWQEDGIGDPEFFFEAVLALNPAVSINSYDASGVWLYVILAPTCSDGEKNQNESDVDCGGVCGANCELDEICNDDVDCLVNNCVGNVCTALPTCSDNIQNQGETDMDCGGPVCGATCNLGESCLIDSDCDSDDCGAGDVCVTCVLAGASWNETDVTDGDVVEMIVTGTDCDASDSVNFSVWEDDFLADDPSTTVVDGYDRTTWTSVWQEDGVGDPEFIFKAFLLADPGASWTSGLLNVAPSCSDGFENQDETDVDCGGVCGATCAIDDSCDDNGDCSNDNCIGNVCTVPTCSDGVQNQGETDMDCGGPCGATCDLGEDCSIDGDCDSDDCGAGNVCVTCEFTGASWNESAVITGDVVEMIVAGTNCDASDAIDFSIWEDDLAGNQFVETINGNFDVETWTSVWQADISGDPEFFFEAVLVADAGISWTSGLVDVAPSCSDGFENQDETDLDCGGVCGATCSVDDACDDNGDCSNGNCIGNVCAVPTCSDGVQNQGETDLDCGGPCGATCDLGEDCSIDGDCDSDDCGAGNVCVTCVLTGASWNESAVVGGDVVEMIVTGTDCDASDAVNFSVWEDDLIGDDPSTTVIGNYDRTTWTSIWMVDAVGNPEFFFEAFLVADPGAIWTSGLLDVAPSCFDGVENQDESDVDCGGVCGSNCAVDDSCDDNGDCSNDNCVGNVCTVPTCSDGIQNQGETDLDCGGPNCAGTCDLGEDCSIPGDCISDDCVGNVCVTCEFTGASWNESAVITGDVVEMIVAGTNCDASDAIDFSIWEDDGGADDFVVTINDNFDIATWISVWQDDGIGVPEFYFEAVLTADAGVSWTSGLVDVAPSCSDGFENQDESDVDCGGVCGSNCAVDDSCDDNGDCSNDNCVGNVCTVPTCSDGVQNQGETDLDCGGLNCVGTCIISQVCSIPGDCVSDNCVGGFCAAPLTCSGTPHACSVYDGQKNNCQGHGQSCTWSNPGKVCQGTHTSCTTYSDSSTCTSHSCTWA